MLDLPDELRVVTYGDYRRGRTIDVIANTIANVQGLRTSPVLLSYLTAFCDSHAFDTMRHEAIESLPAVFVDSIDERSERMRLHGLILHTLRTAIAGTINAAGYSDLAATLQACTDARDFERIADVCARSQKRLSKQAKHLPILVEKTIDVLRGFGNEPDMEIANDLGFALHMVARIVLEENIWAKGLEALDGLGATIAA